MMVVQARMVAAEGVQLTVRFEEPRDFPFGLNVE